MRTECAVLCDAASVRDGLLHILGAGVTRVSMTQLPGGLPVTFAFRVVLETRELRDRHKLHLQLMDYSSDRATGELEINFRIEDPESATEEAALAAPIPLNVLEVPGPGRYVLEASFDSKRIVSIPLRVDRMAAPAAQTENRNGR
jgi:hypothetical protein